MNVAAEDAHGEGVEDFFLDGSFEWASPVDGVISGGGDLGFGGIGKFQGDPPVSEAIHESGELDFDDLLDLGNAKSAEDDDVIEAVDEFGSEVEAEFIDHFGFDFFELFGIEEAVAVMLTADI